MLPLGTMQQRKTHRVTFCAWIRLINLPFECWTVARVAALVSGFGRFEKADATTKAVTDLRAFRCQITLDSLTDIPQNLSIVLREEVFSIIVHLESWERAVDEANQGPLTPPHVDPNNGYNQSRDRGNSP
uniref:DUF4283 domain-containing protein n=1 Tax=Ananas comosus var. bracteatus TaxID=296719 RepID=A0A6V7PPD0_ANACO|nr:unnamed protein product [Ananas comosus var. bracteatus]